MRVALGPLGSVPTRGSDGAAGLDLRASHDVVVPARFDIWRIVVLALLSVIMPVWAVLLLLPLVQVVPVAIVATDVSLVGLPEGTYARIAPRSGLAAKHAIDVGAGVVDADYRGEIKVVLFNHGRTPFSVRRGDRIAQVVLTRAHPAECAVGTPKAAPSTRGAAGFGSTGSS